EEFGGRIVHIREGQIWRRRFRIGVELVQEPLDPLMAAPSNYVRRNLATDRRQHDSRVTGERPYLADDVTANRPRQLRIIQKRDMIGPRNSDDQFQTGPRGLVQQIRAWYRVGPHRVYAELPHQLKIVRDAVKLRKLIACLVRSERAVGNALHEKPALPFV